MENEVMNSRPTGCVCNLPIKKKTTQQSCDNPRAKQCIDFWFLFLILWPSFLLPNLQIHLSQSNQPQPNSKFVQNAELLKQSPFIIFSFFHPNLIQIPKYIKFIQPNKKLTFPLYHRLIIYIQIISKTPNSKLTYSYWYKPWNRITYKAVISSERSSLSSPPIWEDWSFNGVLPLLLLPLPPPPPRFFFLELCPILTNPPLQKSSNSSKPTKPNSTFHIKPRTHISISHRVQWQWSEQKMVELEKKNKKKNKNPWNN